MNALTMLAIPVYMLTVAPDAALAFTLSIIVHTCASLNFHLMICAAQSEPPLVSTRLVRASMDVDMALIHVTSIVSLIIHARGSAQSALALLLNAAALARIWRSRALPYGPALESELVFQRYPLIFVVTMYEALLMWLHGDDVHAAFTLVFITLVCALVLADSHLGGWGHPLAHVVLLPAIINRTEALSVVMSGGR